MTHKISSPKDFFARQRLLTKCVSFSVGGGVVLVFPLHFAFSTVLQRFDYIKILITRLIFPLPEFALNYTAAGMEA